MGTPPLWKRVATLSAAFLVSCLRITDVHGSAVMSVDISSEWMKVVAFPSGASMEKAIGKEYVGKIGNAIAFDGGERMFGEGALHSGIYHSADCYVYFLDLIGKKIDNPVVELYKKRFPQNSIVAHPQRNTVLFKRSDSEERYSPEELVAMLLEEAKYFAKNKTKEDVNEAVISVPSYFGQAERTAMLIAANMAGIKVIQLINSCTAAALNYGTLHADKFYKTAPVHMMFYDMDAYGTQASIVSYQLVNSEDKTVTELRPQLTVLGVGYERDLGGLAIKLRLRDYLATKFNGLKLTSSDVTKDPKAMGKLFIEAEKLKKALSSKTEKLVKVKSLIDKKDLEIKVTREELDELCKDIFDQVVLTARKALESSGLTTELIEQVILVGTASEVPRVQDRLVKDLGLSRLLDTNGAVLGAAYKAADCSDGFEVKPFITNDATLFPVQVTFDEEVFYDDKPAKRVRHILFGHMSPYPKHHFITFNKHQRDIAFTVDYVGLDHLDENQISCLGSLSMGKFTSHGIQEAYSKYQGQKAVEAKGIEACISIDESGLLVLPKVELLVEKTVTEDNTDSVSDSKNLKVLTVKEAIRVDSEYSFVAPIQDDELQSSIDKLKNLKNINEAIAQTQESLHKLLQEIYNTRVKIDKPEYASALTDTEKKTVIDKCTELSIWLARGGTDAKAEELDSKYDEFKQFITPVWTRVSERSERPLKLEALNNALHRSNLFLKEIKMTTLDNAPFTQVEIDTFEKLIVETTNWRDHQVEKQEKLPKNVDSELTIEEIEVIRSSLEDQLSKFTSLKLKIKEEPKVEEPKLQTDDEKAKMIEEIDSDTIVKTKTSQDDEAEDFDKNEEFITIEDYEDLENQFTTSDSRYFKPIVLTKTGQNEDNKNIEL